MTAAPGGRETEFKFSVQDGDALLAVGRAAGGQAGAVLRQVNHFFDSADGRLNQGKFVLRLRDENGGFFVTAKGPQTTSKSGTLSTKAEEEITVDAALAGLILAGTRSPLDVLRNAPGSTVDRTVLLDAMAAALAGQPLQHAGSFENQRTHWPVTLRGPGFALAVTLEMDRTTFPGGVVHHEVEVEIPAGADATAAEAALTQLFASAGVKTWSAPSKAKRFFAALAGKPV